jgi:hypothetical protein
MVWYGDMSVWYEQKGVQVLNNAWAGLSTFLSKYLGYICCAEMSLICGFIDPYL